MGQVSEDPAERARHYIVNFQQTFEQLAPITKDCLVKAPNIARVEDAIERYLRDARHYLEENKPTTALASIAYAEGLLDALSFLELIKDKVTR